VTCCCAIPDSPLYRFQIALALLCREDAWQRRGSPYQNWREVHVGLCGDGPVPSIREPKELRAPSPDDATATEVPTEPNASP